MFLVSPKKEKELKEKMIELGVREEDIIETFTRSSGAGGQKVNKTSTAVFLHHLPSGIKVKCQTERSQALNRFLARRILLDKIEQEIKGKQSSERERIEKIRRQKRRRSRRAKARMLEEKRRQSEKKAGRAGIQFNPSSD